MLSNAPRFRRMSAGFSLILGPLFLLISSLLQSRGFFDVHDLLTDIAKRPLANELSFAFALVGFVLFIPATMGLLHLLKHNAVAFGHIGGALLILGMVSFAFVAGTEALLYIAGADTSIEQNAIIAINDRLGQSVVYNFINIAEVLGYFFGTIFLAIALFRSGVIPRILALLLALAIVIRFTLAGFYMATVLGDCLYTITFAYIGFSVLKMSDEDWEH